MSKKYEYTDPNGKVIGSNFGYDPEDAASGFFLLQGAKPRQHHRKRGWFN